jgi:hypothetical protein
MTTNIKFELNEDTFLIYAIKHYDNPSCSGMKEFLDDLKSFKYLKRLLKRYLDKKDLKERLIINHMIVLQNVFGPEATTQMLFFKLDEQYWPVLKTFLIYLNYIDIDGKLLNGKDIVSIGIDFNVVTKLRNI